MTSFRIKPLKKGRPKSYALVRNFFRLVVTLDCSNVQKSFVFHQVERVFFSTSYFSPTTLLDKPFSKSFKALYFWLKILSWCFLLANIIACNFIFSRNHTHFKSENKIKMFLKFIWKVWDNEKFDIWRFERILAWVTAKCLRDGGKSLRYRKFEIVSSRNIQNRL